MIAAEGLGELTGWAALGLGMALSFIYSGMETGAYVVNKVRLDLRAESGDSRARRLRAMLRQPDKPLIVILIGNNLANNLASAGVVMMLAVRLQDAKWWHSAAILTPLVFIFCELLPKNLFQRHGETLAYATAWFLDLSRRVFTALGLMHLVRGLIWVVLRLAWNPARSQAEAAGAKSEHIVGILDEGQASGVLTHAQGVMAERVVNIGAVRLRDVLVPLDRAELVSESVSVEEIRGALASSNHPRFGVYSGARENIVGLLNAYDVLLDTGDAPPSSHMTAPVKLSEGSGITGALVRLRTCGTVMGFVYTDEGECLGLVSVKDLVEEIVGELVEW